MYQLPHQFVQTVQQTFAPEGAIWLDNLPTLLKTVADKYDLALGSHFDLSYNYVTAVTDQNGRDLVLKLGVPNPELSSEIEALRLYNGRGAVQLIKADVAQGLIILERVRPGETLHKCSEENDALATRYLAEVMTALWRPLPTSHPFPTIIDWGHGLQRLRARYGGGTGPFPAELVARAEKMYAQAAVDPTPYVLLHGDLHQGNVLSGTKRPWVAIDPKGVAGPPIYEVGAWLRNPAPTISDPADLIASSSRRVAIFAEQLGFDREEIIEWAIAQAVLSTWWTIEDHGTGWEFGLELARSLSMLGT